MKKFFAAALAAILLLTLPGTALAEEEEREIPEGYVETTYYELTFVVPEDWVSEEFGGYFGDVPGIWYETMPDDGKDSAHPIYLSAREIGEDGWDLWDLDDVDTVDVLAYYETQELSRVTDRVRELCEIDGRIGLRVTIKSRLGADGEIAQEGDMDEYYYLLSNRSLYELVIKVGTGETSSISEDIADTIVDSIIVTPAE